MSFPIGFKPMLAGKYEPKLGMNFPMYAQPKIDGIRCMIHDCTAFTRTLKMVPNLYIQDFFSKIPKKFTEGLDGEIVVRTDSPDKAYRETMSGVMSEDGEPDFVYYVFDLWTSKSPYEKRYLELQERLVKLEPYFHNLGLLETYRIDTVDRLNAYEQKCLAENFEGVIIRSPQGPYKFGRASSRSQELLKLKRFLDDEAEVIGFKEQMHNSNEATKDAFGRTERSSKKDGMIPDNTLGALEVRWGNIEFDIGTGFDFALRREIWKNPKKYIGKILKFKYVEVGDYNKPRFPVFLGWRDKADI